MAVDSALAPVEKGTFFGKICVEIFNIVENGRGGLTDRRFLQSRFQQRRVPDDTLLKMLVENFNKHFWCRKACSCGRRVQIMSPLTYRKRKSGGRQE